MYSRWALILAVTTALASESTTDVASCSSKKSDVVSFVVTSQRNASGHRHVTADVNHRGETGGTSDTVRLEVSQQTCVMDRTRQLHITTSLNVPGSREPPSGYELVPELGWYRLHLTPLTWEEARLACEAEGAHLAVLNSPQEAAALKGISDRVPKILPGTTWSDEIFIGFLDMTEGQYTTIFGESLSDAGYTEWHPGQPDNLKTSFSVKQDCGSFVRSSGKLNDSTCKAKLAYFCEFSI